MSVASFIYRRADAVELLRAEHRVLRVLFEQCAGRTDLHDKTIFAREICAALSLHLMIEHEVFYAAAAPLLDGGQGGRALSELQVEHEVAHRLIERLDAMSPDDASYDAVLKVLARCFIRHAEAEESDVFPELRAADVDLVPLAERMRAYRADVERRLYEADG